MKVLSRTVSALAIAAATCDAHTIFQAVYVNNQNQGSLVALRAPSTNNPVYNVTSDDIICQVPGTTSTDIINVAPGDDVGAYFGHVIGGAQFPGDPDNPIASSHKGPVIAWLAKVDDAATTPKTGLEWFKIWEDTFDPSTTTWGVDDLIANAGIANFTMPECLAPGNYLMRVEIIALHSAYAEMGAQFYMSCAQINVSGSGSGIFSPSQTYSFPGVYSQTDPSILINIYGPTGQPDNGGKPYNAPGNVSVIAC